MNFLFQLHAIGETWMAVAITSCLMCIIINLTLLIPGKLAGKLRKTINWAGVDIGLTLAFIIIPIAALAWVLVPRHDAGAYSSIQANAYIAEHNTAGRISTVDRIFADHIEKNSKP